MSTPSCAPFPGSQKNKSTKVIRDWRGASASDHFVQFYRTDDYLIECLAGYVAEGVWNRDIAVVIATPEHRIALEERLRAKSVDIFSTMLERQYLAFDAREMLSKFMFGDRPDRTAFMKVMGDLVRKATAGGRQLRAFGEMVALLWMDGKRAAAIELEQLWNELSREHAFALFCAYPAVCMDTKGNGPSLEHVCDHHSCVIS
ncbi:MAG: MEDS domain-containing protein, partial [Opitutaceae bacterium]